MPEENKPTEGTIETVDPAPIATPAAQEPKEKVTLEPREDSRRVYSEDEVELIKKTMRDGHEGTVAEMRRQLDEVKKAREEDQAKAQERELTEFLRQSEEGGIPRDMAQRFVDAQKALFKQQKDFSLERERMLADKAKLNEAMRIVTANDLAKQYSLSDEDKGELLNMTTPEVMREKALTLALAKAKASGSQPPKVDDGRDKGETTNLTTMPEATRAGHIWEEAFRK